MDFESILKDWENRRDRSRLTPPRTELESDWLDRYPPGRGDTAEKETGGPPPVSGGTAIWKRRDPQDTLDLHGLTGEEARGALDRFIASLRGRGFRKALVVHGKGLHSPDGSVLKPLVREFLESSSEVGEFGKAGRKDGGSGATWFILRQRSR